MTLNLYGYFKHSQQSRAAGGVDTTNNWPRLLDARKLKRHVHTTGAATTAVAVGTLWQDMYHRNCYYIALAKTTT